MTQTLLAPGGPLRQQLIAFARGVDLSRLPLLQRTANSFMFISNLEASVERLHAYVNQRVKIAHHHSPAYVSTTLRKPELLGVHAQQAAVLSEYCSKVHNPVRVVDTLGLQFHPSFSPHLRVAAGSGATLEHSVPVSLVCNVVYRCDLPAQYSELPPLVHWGDHPPDNGDDDDGAGDEDVGAGVEDVPGLDCCGQPFFFLNFIGNTAPW